ncbi:glycosyltransferase family 2 protein [Alphaproteobacteria bacterium]|nr:glycosyltransferase family 2 protein [Alphaproteobacteria bacterium]
MNNNIYKIAILLPVYNEGKSIYDLLSRINTLNFKNSKIVIVDDHSTDKSSEWINKANDVFSDLDITVIKHEINQGLGGALNSGLNFILNLSNSLDVVITMDGDNTHDPELIFKMLDQISKGAEIVIASRYLKESKIIGVPNYRKVLSYGARVLYTLRWNISGVRDYTCLYRAYKYSIIEKSFNKGNHTNLKEKDFIASTELLRSTSRNTKKVYEVPIVLNYNYKFEVSNMKIFKTILRTLKVLANIK